MYNISRIFHQRLYDGKTEYTKLIAPVAPLDGRHSGELPILLWAIRKLLRFTLIWQRRVYVVYVSISQLVIGCEDCLWYDLDCVAWDVKLFSNYRRVFVAFYSSGMCLYAEWSGQWSYLHKLCYNHTCITSDVYELELCFGYVFIYNATDRWTAGQTCTVTWHAPPIILLCGWILN